jgi:hypothetical protein
MPWTEMDDFKSGTVQMKLVTIVWNVLLVAITGIGLVFLVPKIYEQASYRLHIASGDRFNSPILFDGCLVTASFLACIAALSYFFNRRLGAVARSIATVFVFLLLAAWIASAVLWRHQEMPPKSSILYYMMTFDGSALVAFAIVSFLIGAIYGRGPLKLLSQFLHASKTDKGQH